MDRVRIVKDDKFLCCAQLSRLLIRGQILSTWLGDKVDFCHRFKVDSGKRVTVDSGIRLRSTPNAHDKCVGVDLEVDIRWGYSQLRHRVPSHTRCFSLDSALANYRHLRPPHNDWFWCNLWVWAGFADQVVLLIAFNSIVDLIDFRTDPDMPLMLTDPNGSNIVQFILSYVYCEERM
jgi:hypothetical protein